MVLPGQLLLRLSHPALFQGKRGVCPDNRPFSRESTQKIVITHLWHHITHRHTQASKENLGNLIICGWRFPGANCTVYFQPELDGAGWTPLPAAIFEEVLGQDSPYAAMALIRKTQTEGQS